MAEEVKKDFHPADTNGDGKVSKEEHDMYLDVLVMFSTAMLTLCLFSCTAMLTLFLIIFHFSRFSFSLRSTVIKLKQT